jgi:hypothetical protein
MMLRNLYSHKFFAPRHGDKNWCRDTKPKP